MYICQVGRLAVYTQYPYKIIACFDTIKTSYTQPAHLLDRGGDINGGRLYNSTKGSEQEDEDAIFREWNHSIRGMCQKSVTELRI